MLVIDLFVVKPFGNSYTILVVKCKKRKKENIFKLKYAVYYATYCFLLLEGTFSDMHVMGTINKYWVTINYAWEFSTTAMTMAILAFV